MYEYMHYICAVHGILDVYWYVYTYTYISYIYIHIRFAYVNLCIYIYICNVAVMELDSS